MDVEVRVVSIGVESGGGHQTCGSGRPSILQGGWAYNRRVVGVGAGREGGDIWAVAVGRGIQGGSWVVVVDG